MKISIGRIVHYTLREGVVRPAIAVDVPEGENLTEQAELKVFTSVSDGLETSVHAVRSDVYPPAVGTWNWPPRV